MALHILSEALARIEYKIDLIVSRLGFLDKTPIPPMRFSGVNCPVCSVPVEYQVDVTHNVVVRKCECTTGKVPSIIPLIPLGESNGNTPSDPNKESAGRSSSNRGRR